MERKDLTDLKLSDDQVEKVMGLYGKDINGLKEQLATAEQERDSFKSQVSDRDKQIDELSSKAGNSEKLNKTIDDLKATIKQNDENAATELTKVKTDNAIQSALKDAHVRDPKLAASLLDRDIIKLDEHGEVMGLSDQLDKIKESHDYLFDSEDGKPKDPKINAFKNGNPGDGANNTSDDAFAQALGLHASDASK